MRLTVAAAVVLALSGCATSYQLAVMPRDTGRIYSGTAEDTGRGEGPISITIENRTYNGTWVATVPERSSGWISGGLGWGRRGWGWGGVGTTITMDNPAGGEAKALLASADGAGLRCDLRTGQGRGGGVCRDDKGKEYDVQLRAASRQ